MKVLDELCALVVKKPQGDRVTVPMELAAAIVFELERLRKVREAVVDRKRPAEIEMEGGGSSWWFVCGECHGAVDRKDRFCRHCGTELIGEKGAGKV